MSGPDATAGSTPIFEKNIGMSVPTAEEIIIDKARDTPTQLDTANAI